ncbi:MAG TPA: universal stress protein [Chloroflexota bacterium]|nr:universal stress protein [Chloroflexota bacterium]
MADGPVLAAVDGGRNDARVLHIAAGEALRDDCELVALHVLVIGWERALEDADEESILEDRRILERAEKLLAKRSHGKYRRLAIQARSAGGAIVETARNLDARLIVMGCPRLLGDEIVDFGLTASFVLGNTDCPVLLWRNPT